MQRARSLVLVLLVVLSLASLGAGCGTACRTADLAPLGLVPTFLASFAEGGRSALVRLDESGAPIAVEVSGTETVVWADEATRVLGSTRLGLAPLLPWGATSHPTIVTGPTDVLWGRTTRAGADLVEIAEEARVGGARDVITWVGTNAAGQPSLGAIVTGADGVVHIDEDHRQLRLDTSALSDTVPPGPWRMGDAMGGVIVVGLDRAEETDSGTIVEAGAVAIFDRETRGVIVRAITGLSRCREVASGGATSTRVAVMCLGDGSPNSAGVVVLDLTEPDAPVESVRWIPSIPTQVPSHDLAYVGGDELLFVAGDATEERLVALDLLSVSATTLLVLSRQRDAETPAIGAAVWNASTLLVAAGSRGLIRFAIPEGGRVTGIDPGAGTTVDVGCAAALDALEVRAFTP